MKRPVTGCVLAIALAAAAAAVPTQAEARRGWYATGVIGGMSANEILGWSHPYQGPGTYGAPAYHASPAAFGPPPGCIVRPQRVWAGYRWQWRKLRICH